MSKGNWIKLHREMLKWGWYSDSATKDVFLHLLLTANYEESYYHGEPIGIGEAVFGRKQLAEKLGLSERQVRTALTHLKSTNEITIRTTNKYSVATIVKWDFYQGCDDESDQQSDQRIDQQATSNRPAIDQQSTTSKNIINKELKKEKKDIYSRERIEIVNYLNEICGTSYRPNTVKTKECINARLNEGFTVDDFKTVIYKKAKQWKDDAKMVKFLRPETLFGNKFEGYLNEMDIPTGKDRWKTDNWVEKDWGGLF